MTSVAASFLSLLTGRPNRPRTVEAVAAPGLVTLLDVALYRSNEGGLTSTVCATNATLSAFLELKQQANRLLRLVLLSTAEDGTIPTAGTSHSSARESAESFARLCVESASDAIERLTTDRLSQSANLPLESGPGGTGGTTGGGSTGSASSSSSLVGVSSSSGGVGSTGIVEGVLESARTGDGGRRWRQPPRRDCWESPRLLCPDFVWADEAHSACQRLVRLMAKHRFVSGAGAQGVAGMDAVVGGGWSALSPSCIRVADQIWGLIRDDLPVRLHQFRAAIESDTVVSKRLYLVKCEYRAPFRAFLEAHNAVQKAPRSEMVDEFIRIHDGGDSAELDDKKKAAERKIQESLENPALVEALKLEQQCEMLEIEMATALLPFSELARVLDNKKARLKAIPGVLELRDVPPLEELLRRLKCILSRKSGTETSTGIRPLLLDLQGVPRDNTCESFELSPFGTYLDMSHDDAIRCRLDCLLSQLQCLYDISKTRGGFYFDRKDADVPASVVRSCSSLDAEMFQAQYGDWYAMVKRQRDLAAQDDPSFEELSETIRRAEIEVSIAMASQPALEMVRQRLEIFENDRMKRFDVLEDMVKEVCLREMDIQVELSPPDKEVVLELPETSALGLFGIHLQMAGEPLPMG